MQYHNGTSACLTSVFGMGTGGTKPLWPLTVLEIKSVLYIAFYGLFLYPFTLRIFPKTLLYSRPSNLKCTFLRRIFLICTITLLEISLVHALVMVYALLVASLQF